MARSVGLIAGQGRFPFAVARAARRHGHRVVAVGIRDLADVGLEAEVDEFTTLALGELAQQPEEPLLLSGQLLPALPTVSIRQHLD